LWELVNDLNDVIDKKITIDKIWKLPNYPSNKNKIKEFLNKLKILNFNNIFIIINYYL